MTFRNNIRFASAVTLLSIFGIAGHANAKEDIVSSGHKRSQLKTSATGCLPATQAIDLDINNVRARLMTGGDMWWNIGEGVASYEIPKGSGKSSQFAASCWIGGFDKQGQLKVAAQTYRQSGNDYWPGSLDVNAKITSDVCANWDKQWKVNRADINSFIQLSKTGGNTTSPVYDYINTWPATGNPKATGASGTLTLNPNFTYAPFKDLNGNGIYEPNKGEYPDITGDQYIWWVFNDAGNVKQQSLTSSMGIEVQTSAFAYATQDFLNNATFCNYKVINRGALTIDSTYIAVWDDCDLGYAFDDFIGCDTLRGLGIQYNGTNDDGGAAGHPVNSYGNTPPQVGLDFFQGPRRIIHRSGQTDTFQLLGMTNFTYYNNDFSVIGNPDNGVQIYNYMTGSIKDGERFTDDFQGAGLPSKGFGTGPVSNFVFWGDPGNKSDWSECACNNNPGDRRFIFSSGPFELISGATNDITFGCVWASGLGGCPQTNFKTIKNIDDGAQALFDSHFKTTEGPEAPRMVIRELDRKLVFYLVNDYGSNNYGENYGNTSGAYNDSIQYHQVVVKSKGISNDSLYHFQGYRVFQLANSSVSTADIFDPNTGEVNTAKAVEVFECDKQDSVKQIVNYAKNLAVSDTTNIAQIKVNGRDSGIAHSFVLTRDQFATGSDKQFINYHTYYFVAIAYAYNNFAPFDPKNTVATQDVPYIGSAHGAGGTNIVKVVAVPNPANGEMGTVLNSDYGSGVIITRIEGQGNGGNTVQLDLASEAEAISNGRVKQASYLAGQGPVNVKVIDPVKVPADISNWVLQISGNYSPKSGGFYNGSWKLTGFQNGVAKDTIYSEESITGNLNEQIIEKYGLSVSIQQKKAPGFDQVNGNGYITSDITFDDPSKPWLAGVPDQPDSSFANWLRCGNNHSFGGTGQDPTKPPKSLNQYTNPCDFNDYTKADTNSAYQNLLSNYSFTKSTWGPYVLAAGYIGLHGLPGNGTQCGFEVAFSKNTQDTVHLHNLPDVNVVFTADRSKWTRCAVIEEQEEPTMAEGGAHKFTLRKHASWNLDYTKDGNGNEIPVYSGDGTDQGMSWFPGYAIDEGTGERLNIVFGEDSWLQTDHGRDMLWNPSSTVFDNYDASIVFGGKHVIYVSNTKYDSDKVFVSWVNKYASTGSVANGDSAYQHMQWVGIPLLNPLVPFKSISEGFIPNTATLRFRVNRPYAPYQAVDTATFAAPPGVMLAAGSAGSPYYSFRTDSLAPTVLGPTTDRDKLLNRIYAVPNPYYGFSGYEANRLDTKVRIINLPATVTIHIYSLDGSLVRTLTKNDPNTSYIDWDIRNSSGLPIASGMYLMDVKAEGLGEIVVRWFGAMRPIDISSY
jgi:hypothetical protein